MKKTKIAFAAVMAVSIIFLMTACNGGRNTKDKTEVEKAKYTFTLALDSPEDTVTYLFADKFKQLLQEKSGGRMEVQVYSNGQMGGDAELIESVQAGDIDFAVQNTAPQVNFIPELAVFDMPSVFPNVKIARETLDGPFFDKVNAVYEQSGFKLLAFTDQGFRTLSTNKKVKTMSDFKGQKIRTMENPYHVAYWKALGANPTPMAFSEVYIGLQQGTIDAQENPYEVIVSAKLYEQQKYVIDTNHLLHIITLITNPSKYKKMASEDQKIVNEAATEAKVWARTQADQRVAEKIRIMKEKGVEIIELTPELQAEMAKKSQGIYNMIRSKIGSQLPDSLLEGVEAAKNK